MATVGIQIRQAMQPVPSTSDTAPSVPYPSSLLFAIDPSSNPSRSCWATEPPCHINHDTYTPQSSAEERKRVQSKKDRIAWFSKPSGSFENKLLREVRFAKARMSKDGDDENDCVMLGSRLCTMGFNAIVRRAVGGGEACFSNLRHEFLLVIGDGDYEGAEFIVEPRLKEHFVIPHATQAYKDLLDNLPSEFVGASSRLVPIIQDLCCEMELSFRMQGLTRPPWRRSEAMLSKWLPMKAKDTCLSDGGLARKSAPWESTTSAELVPSSPGKNFFRKSLLSSISASTTESTFSTIGWK